MNRASVNDSRLPSVYTPNVGVACDVRRPYIRRMPETIRDTERKRSPLRVLMTRTVRDHIRAREGTADASAVRLAVRGLLAGTIDASAYQIGVNSSNDVTYFVRMELPDARMRSPIKVGMSSNVAARIGALEMASPFPLTLLATAPLCVLHERHVHDYFAHARLRGEWFAPHALLRRLVREVCAFTEARRAVV